jgi:hypothetical protein
LEPGVDFVAAQHSGRNRASFTLFLSTRNRQSRFLGEMPANGLCPFAHRLS